MKEKKFSVNYIQFKVCVKRYYELIFSDKVSMVMLLLQAPLMLVILSLVCPRDCFTNIKILWQSDTTLFIIVVMAAMMGLLNSYREVCKERDIFAREYDAGLDTTAYILSKLFVLGSVCLVQSFILFAGSYLVIDFPNPSPVFTQVLYWIILFLIMFSSSVTGIFISSILKSSDSAILPVLLVLIMQVVMSGNIVELEGFLETLSIFCVSRWGLSALGQVFNRNGLFPAIPETQNACYDQPLLLCIVVLLLICVILTVISIVWLNLSFKKRQKKFKNGPAK